MFPSVHGRNDIAVWKPVTTRPVALMIAADVHVNLRSPTMGETSGTAIRALSLGRPLIVTENGSENLFLAERNIPYVQIRDVQGLDPATLVGARHVVMTAEAVKKVEEWLS